MTSSFDVRGILRFKLDYDREPLQLSALMAPYRVSDQRQDDVVVSLRSVSTSAVPPGAVISSGIYKGVAWQAVLERGADGSTRKISFYCPLFLELLAMQMVIMPLIKERVLKQGGFSLWASAVRSADSVIVMFGEPGVGKTRKALEAIGLGWNLVADNDLVFLPDGTVAGLFDEIELRYGTVAGTVLWKRLNRVQKIRLFLSHLISKLFLNRVGFNLVVKPSALGINASGASLPGDSLAFVFLRQSPLPGPLELEPAVRIMVDYEKWYQSIYGSFIYSAPDEMISRMRANCLRLLGGSAIGCFSVDRPFGEIVNATSNRKT